MRLRREDFYVDDVPRHAGMKMIERYHYARGGSKTHVYFHGLFRRADDHLVAVAQWLPPTRPAALFVDPAWTQVLSLSRLVASPMAPRNSCSFLLGRCARIIEHDGRFRTLLTFACDSQGHEGGIYRASNWVYAGKTEPKSRWINPRDGRQVAEKSTVNRTRDEMLALGYVRTGSFRKSRFALFLGRGVEIALLRAAAARQGLSWVMR